MVRTRRAIIAMMALAAVLPYPAGVAVAQTFGWDAQAAAPQAVSMLPRTTTGLTASPSSWPLPPVARVERYRPLPGDFVDYDDYLSGQGKIIGGEHPWSWQILPSGLVYDNYLAGTKESRFAAHTFKILEDGWYFSGVLGSRVGLLRYGSCDAILPQGFQIDAEGAAHLRLDLADDVEVQAVDFRAGMPITFGRGRHRTKLAYYHLSSHLGDEFLLKNPGFNRLNFSRDVLVLGHAVYLNEQLRVYAEAGWAFRSDVSLPWEFQFGTEYAPARPTGIHGAPFFAVNGHLREEVDFGGGLTLQFGWAWVGDTGSLLRTGLHYYNGESNQFSFFDEHENQLGLGVWYDR